MDSILTIVTPAAGGALLMTTVARLQGDLILEDFDDKEEMLERAILSVSAVIARRIGVASDQDGKVTLAREEALEVFPRSRVTPGAWRDPPALLLSRYPVATIVSVLEDGVLTPRLLEGDVPNPDFLYELDGASGRLWKTDGAGNRVCWAASRIAVQYFGGYILPGAVTEETASTLPPELEAACVDFCQAKIRTLQAEIDGSLVSESFPGLWSGTFAQSTLMNGLPDAVEGALAPFIRVDI